MEACGYACVPGRPQCLAWAVFCSCSCSLLQNKQFLPKYGGRDAHRPLPGSGPRAHCHTTFCLRRELVCTYRSALSATKSAQSGGVTVRTRIRDIPSAAQIWRRTRPQPQPFPMWVDGWWPRRMWRVKSGVCSNHHHLALDCMPRRGVRADTAPCASSITSVGLVLRGR